MGPKRMHSKDVNVTSFTRRQLLWSLAAASAVRPTFARALRPPTAYQLSADERGFLEAYAHSCCLYFTEQSSPHTGLVLDRTDMFSPTGCRNVASIAATGFGLTALCIAAEHGWLPKQQARM